MKYPPELFRDDYNLDALQRVRPPGQRFEFFVTPRFVSHYADHRFEPLTSALIRSVSRRKEIFIDVGAHYGFFTILAGLENTQLEVHALEPIPENMEILRRNLELNELSAIRCHEKAASNRVGQAQFQKSRAADNSSFQTHPEVPRLAEIEVETLTLATLLDSRDAAPLLVKIDTDGHEIPILEGLEDSLSRSQDVTLIVELNPIMQKQAGHEPEDLLAKLEEMGFATFLLQEEEYRLVPIDPRSDWSALLGSAGYANLYCRPKDAVVNVCFLSHSDALAGAERSLAELVEQLVEYHGAVCNVVIPGDGPLRARIENAGAGVIMAEYGWWCGSDRPSDEVIRERLGDDLARFLATTLPEVERTRPDLICTNSMVIPFGAILASILHRPHIWSLREYGGEQNGYQFYLPFEEVLKVVAGFSDFIFGASRSLLPTLFPGMAQADYDFLYPHIRTPVLPKPGGLPCTPTEGSPPLKLIELSSLARSKQQETDLRAVAELLHRGHETTLLLKGPQDAEYVEFLEQLSRSLKIADRVTFEDYSEDIWSLLDAADAVLISAPTHCFGRIAAEGMLRAKPVVYPAGTDIAEYMEDGVTGLGYDAGDPQQMADQIERLILDPALRHQIGAEAHRQATELFSREGFADKFLEQARRLKASEPGDRPPLPRPVLESLLTGIQRLSRESLELRHQVRARSEELAHATILAASRDREITALQPVLAARDQELASLKPILEARQEELANLNSLLVARDDELASVKPALEARNEELAALKNTLEEHHRELAAIKPVLSARDEELAAIKPVLSARDEELAAIKPALSARDEELAATRPVLAAREEEIANLELSREHQATEIQNLSAHLEGARGILDRLRHSRFGKLALWITREK
jgi:FkbM family methyltransferase